MVQPFQAPPSTCSRCGAAFACGMKAGETTCWCAALPPLAPVPGRDCLCKACLEKALSERGD